MTTCPHADLRWTCRTPESPGAYWYVAPGSYEPPVRVRLEAAASGLRAWFPDLPVPVPMRMLAGARWSGPLAGQSVHVASACAAG